MAVSPAAGWLGGLAKGSRRLASSCCTFAGTGRALGVGACDRFCRRGSATRVGGETFWRCEVGTDFCSFERELSGVCRFCQSSEGCECHRKLQSRLWS